MTFEDVLQELIHCLGSEGDSTLGWEQVRQWPEGAVEVFQKAGWIKATTPTMTVECPGCVENCFMPVRVFPAQNGKAARAVVACDRRDDMGNVKIPLARLQQWQAYPRAGCPLGFRCARPKRQARAGQNERDFQAWHGAGQETGGRTGTGHG